MGVLGSAAEAFVELEMWEEVVSCYRQMEQVGGSRPWVVSGLCPCSVACSR